MGDVAWVCGAYETSPAPETRFSKGKTSDEVDAEGGQFFYLGPAPNHPRDTVRVLNESHSVIVTRNVTWQAVAEPATTVNKEASPPVKVGEGDAADLWRIHGRSCIYINESGCACREARNGKCTRFRFHSSATTKMTNSEGSKSVEETKSEQPFWEAESVVRARR